MKHINPYKRLQLVNLSFGAIGIVGTLALLGNLIFSWDLGIFSFSVYPVFLINFYQYIQLKKKQISFSKEKIEWDFITSEGVKSIELSDEEIEINSNWKGISIKNGAKHFEISLDGIWKKERQTILDEMKSYYKAD